MEIVFEAQILVLNTNSPLLVSWEGDLLCFVPNLRTKEARCWSYKSLLVSAGEHTSCHWQRRGARCFPHPFQTCKKENLPRSWKESRRHGQTRSSPLRERCVLSFLRSIEALRRLIEGLLAREAFHGDRLSPGSAMFQALGRDTHLGTSCVKSPKPQLLTGLCGPSQPFGA